MQDTNTLLLELNKGNLGMFRYDYEDHTCFIDLENDLGIILQLSGKSIVKERIELLKNILQNYENYIEAAVNFLKSYQFDLGKNYFLDGIYVGEFSHGTYGFHIFDGFTLSLKREDGTDADLLNLDVYTVQFKNDGHPIGAALWFE